MKEPLDVVSAVPENTKVPAGLVIVSVTMYPAVAPVSLPEMTPLWIPV